MTSTFTRLFIVAFCFVLGLARANATDWPEGYIVHEGSESPDGQYGIILPNDEPTTEESDNYLANLKTHQALGKIQDADYFEHQNHASLAVEWSPDSKWCVASYWGRYGFDSILILEPKDSIFTQARIGERVQKSLDAAMKKQSRDKEISGDAAPYFRLGPDRKLRVRALSQNNPKQFQDVKTYYALFQGTYDLDAKKWTVTDARSITSEQSEALEIAYNDIDTQLESTTYPSEQDKAEGLDQSMNQVYRAAQFILPPARFAEVKKEQVQWLKKRDAVSSLEDKSKLIQKRIKALQDLLW